MTEEAVPVHAGPAHDHYRPLRYRPSRPTCLARHPMNGLNHVKIAIPGTQLRLRGKNKPGENEHDLSRRQAHTPHRPHLVVRWRQRRVETLDDVVAPEVRSSEAAPAAGPQGQAIPTPAPAARAWIVRGSRGEDRRRRTHTTTGIETIQHREYAMKPPSAVPQMNAHEAVMVTIVEIGRHPGPGDLMSETSCPTADTRHVERSAV